MARGELIEARLTQSAIGAFFEVYNRLGFGFLEAIYANALEIELRARGHHVEREVTIQIVYKGHMLGTHRLDMVVDQKLVVETKSSYELHGGAPRQVYSYLHASRLCVALLFHFGPVPRFLRFASQAALQYSSNPENPANPDR